jgi:pyruvate,water dikinase
LWWFRSRSAGQARVRAAFERFRSLIQRNIESLGRIAEAEEMLGGEYLFDRRYLQELVKNLAADLDQTIVDLNALTDNRYGDLYEAAARIQTALAADLEGRPVLATGEEILVLDEVDRTLADLAGEKAARLSEVRRRVGGGVPPGFVVTAAAGRRVLERAGLSPEAAEPDGEAARKIFTAGLPRDLERAIRQAVSSLARSAEAGFAVRSSGVGEDGGRSFAGQYLTLLNVPAAEVPAACLRVIASLFNPTVSAYGDLGRASERPRGMAVLVLPMVTPRAAGVLYSLDPLAAGEDWMVVAATPGLGSTVVEGGAADRFTVSREPPHTVLSRAVADKQTMAVAAPAGGIEQRSVPAGERDRPAVDDATLARLVETALITERVLRSAVDLEWAVDESGQLVLLQARPLRVPAPRARVKDLVGDARRRHRVLIEGVGTVACRGIGAGPVRVQDPREDCLSFPPGAVLVAHETSPLLSGCVARASAVITDTGVALSHLGTVAREFRVPALFGTGVATDVLQPGMQVTVDAEEGVVYEGEVRELLRHRLLESAASEEAAEFRLLRRMLRRISPLRLVDPRSREFTPQGCRTVHDILRFAHEKAVEALSRDLVRRLREPFVKQLMLPVPLDLVVVDIGGAFAPDGRGRWIKPEDLRSVPLARLVAGLTEPGAWSTRPSELDLRGFAASVVRTRALTAPGAALVERNLAVAGRDYLNLNLKLGYHFQMMDCRAGDREEENRISFFFAGGVTEMERRARRAALLGTILSALGFVVETRGDVIAGWLSGVPRRTVEERMHDCGRLIGYTRQLDVLLRNDVTVKAHIRAFLAGEPAPGFPGAG